MEKIMKEGEMNEGGENNEPAFDEAEPPVVVVEPIRKRLVFIEYRGKVTDDYCRPLEKDRCSVSTGIDSAETENSPVVIEICCRKACS